MGTQTRGRARVRVPRAWVPRAWVPRAGSLAGRSRVGSAALRFPEAPYSLVPLEEMVLLQATNELVSP